MHIAWLFLITISVELPIYGYFFRQEYKDWITWCVIICMNLFTWCSAMLLYSKGITDFYTTEVLVMAAEALILKTLLSDSWKKSFWAAFCANIVTAALSFI
jgi:hypothetical protein